MYGSAPLVKAASLESAKDTLSDSDISATATHTIEFDMGTALSAGEYVRVVLASQFSGVSTGNVTCPTNTTASSTGNTVDCVVDAGQTLASTSAQTITITGVTNPSSAGSYDVAVTTYNTSDVEIESSSLKVYILDDVTVTATVNASLTFTVSELGPDSGTYSTVNGVALSASSTGTTLPFGTLSSGASTTLGQALAVSTNATDGYTVTVIMDQPLTSAAGATIDSFKDGTIPAAPEAWSAPSGTLDSPNTYGHMGITTDDADLSTDFTGSKFTGISTSTPLTVMSHNGPADGATINKGLAHVAYSIEITDLQEAGDYTANLTYVCTPTY